MKRTSLILSLLLILFAGGCTSITPNCKAEYENLGYVDVDKVMDDSEEDRVVSEGLYRGCESGDILHLSDGDLYECQETIPSAYSNQVILLRQHIKSEFYEGMPPRCGGGGLVSKCRALLDIPRIKSKYVEKGFVEPFTIEFARNEIINHRLVTSDQKSYRIKKKFDFSSITSWVKEDYKMDLEIGTQTNWNKLLIGEPFVCGMIDAKGRVLFIPDPIEVRNRYLGIF